MRASTSLICSLFWLFVSGCASHETTLGRQMELEARLEQVVQKSTSESASIANLTTEVQRLQENTARHEAALQQLSSQYQEAVRSLDAMTQRIETLSHAGASKIEVVNQETISPEKDAGQQEAYMKAFGLFSANKYEAAIAAFENYLKNFPAGEYAGNAQYWIGECHYTKREYRQALEAFNQVITNYPQGAKLPDAMLKVGFTLISINQPEKAKQTLQALIGKYPNSQAAAKARERLGRP